VDFTGADLREVNLSGANLFGAFFGEAHLTGVHITGADLRRANLKDVQNLTCHQIRETRTDETTELPVSLVCTNRKSKGMAP